MNCSTRRLSLLRSTLCLAWLVSAAPAQVAAPALSSEHEQALAEAAKGIRSASEKRQLAAVEQLATLAPQPGVAASREFANAAARALASEHQAVLAAAVTALLADAHQSAPRAFVDAHLSPLCERLGSLKQPKWPKVPFLGSLPTIPPLPPLGGTKAQKRAYKKKLADAKRRRRAHDQKRKREYARIEREIERARKLDHKLWQAGRELGRFCTALGEVRSDAATQLLLRALSVARAEEPAATTAIVSALCKHPRRDAIVLCLELIDDEETARLRREDGERNRCQRFLFDQLSESERKRRNAHRGSGSWGGKEPPALRSSQLVHIRQLLGELGERFEIAAPVYPKLTREELGRLVADSDFRLKPPQPDKSWQDWWQEVREHVPEKLGG